MTPTQRTLKLLRSQGFAAQVVEQTIPKTFIKRDLYGIIDIIAVNATYTLGIQTTSGSNVAARIRKAIESEHLQLWLSAPNRRFLIHGWRMVKKTRKYECREIELFYTGDGYEVQE